MFQKFLKKKVRKIANFFTSMSGKAKKIDLETKKKKRTFDEKILRESVDRDISAI